jgi:hypothetical protein
MRPRYRDTFGCLCAVWLMHLEAREARELVAHFDHAVFVRFEEEADVAVVDNRNIFVGRCFGGCELDVSVDPGLSNQHTILADG